MIAIRLQAAEPTRAVAAGKGARLALTLLSLAAVAVLVVGLRYGIYEYFHGSDRAVFRISR
jgi:hypothetical protein